MSEQVRTGQYRSVQVRTGQDRSEQVRTGRDSSGNVLPELTQETKKLLVKRTQKTKIKHFLSQLRNDRSGQVRTGQEMCYLS